MIIIKTITIKLFVFCINSCDEGINLPPTGNDNCTECKITIKHPNTMKNKSGPFELYRWN